MTCVIVFSINALMIYVVNNLYGCYFNQRLMTCDCKPIWPMIYMVVSLYGLWPMGLLACVAYDL